MTIGPLLELLAGDLSLRLDHYGLAPTHSGLRPREHQLGEADALQEISKVGDAIMRAALCEGANVMRTQAGKLSALKRWALEVANRRGERAKVVLARGS